MRMKRWICSLVIAAGILLSQGTGIAQGPPRDEPDMTIDPATRSAVIEAALKKLNDNYVFPERQRRWSKPFESGSGARNTIRSQAPSCLATTLQNHLQEVSHDKHLRVIVQRDQAAT